MNVLVGVSGGIAAYKACDLVSRLVGNGHAVRVTMTGNATRFVGPLTFEALSAHPVLTDTFAGAGAPTGGAPGTIDHVNWAKWAQAVIVAPASANTLARIACGLADDALTTVLLAVPEGVPILLAPAMNTAMWTHPATLRNLRWITDLGRYEVIDPVAKRLACGDVGPGALAAVDDLVAWVESRSART
ncbi:MAG: phosphopantothenoylcysteine decarboxylase/phosphopantothenate--cysteine ligase [Pseudomonadota bacterium]|jgi:phosphopantothenoylcysteine decarboxylase/phosphopantothenate--cysteine ligase